MTVLSRQKLNELIGVAFLGSATLMALALLTYESRDPSWNVSASSPEVSNLIGPVGAWISDLLYQILGFAALLIPLALIVAGFQRIRGAILQGWVYKLLSSLFLVSALCAALSLIESALPATFGFSPGGVLGVLLSKNLLTPLSRPGALIVVGTALTAAILLSTSLSLNGLGSRFAHLDWTSLLFWRTWRRRAPASQDGEGRADGSPLETSVGIRNRREVEPEVKLEEEFASLVSGEPARAEKDFPVVPEEGLEQAFRLPPADFLQMPAGAAEIDKEALLQRADQLTAKYAEFDVRGQVLQIHPGPVVTTFEFKPDPGVKYSKVTSLEQDLCLGLKAESVRIDRIPGKNTVGVEVPNAERQIIVQREIVSTTAFHDAESPLTLALGKRINGNTYIADLTRMPHLLIAGATGSGKSVGLNGMVCSILYKSLPSEVRFIMVDPKRLELGLYADIPHLLTPIVHDPKQAANALSWAVSEMEQRYKLLARHGVRNIRQFNELMETKREEAEQEECVPLPYIVIIVDELADLMMTAGKEVEASLTRLAQMARAIGIHLILATQRPSVDVITGLIKANFPCRMSFRVSSKIDSRTIIDQNGAETLLGQGDMLFLPPGTSRLVRLHSPFLSEGEISRVTEFLRQQARPDYQDEILESDDEGEGSLIDVSDLTDSLYEEAAQFVVETRKASTSLLQRRFRIGYGRAARLLDMMEHEGLISPPDGSKAREVLVAPNYFDEVDGS